jgi:hypothetical protein
MTPALRPSICGSGRSVRKASIMSRFSASGCNAPASTRPRCTSPALQLNSMRACCCLKHVGCQHHEAGQRVLFGALRMCALTPKISCYRSSPGPVPAGGTATQASKEPTPAAIEIHDVLTGRLMVEEAPVGLTSQKPRPLR